MGVSSMLEVNNKGVSRVLEGSHKDVKERYTGIKKVLHQSYKNVTRVPKVFLGCHKDVTWVFQWSDMQECNIRSDMSRVTSIVFFYEYLSRAKKFSCESVS